MSKSRSSSKKVPITQLNNHEVTNTRQALKDIKMLVLTRSEDDEILVITNQYEDDPDKKELIKIKILKISPTRVKLGFDTASNVRILRPDAKRQ